MYSIMKNSLITTISVISLLYVASSSTEMDDVCRLVDLTHEMTESSTQYYDPKDKFELMTVFNGTVLPMGYHFEEFKFQSAEHGGTHMDAPSHFSDHGYTVDQVKLETLIGPACVIDVSEQAMKDVDYRLDIVDLINWETEYGPMEPQCVVLMRTGRDKLYKNRSLYYGTPTPSDPHSYHFPGLSTQAAMWLIQQDKMKMFGIDTPSQDYGPSLQFEVHRLLSGRNIPGLENLANLDRLPAKGAIVIALPMKHKGGSGGPTRVIALVGCPKRFPHRNDVLKKIFYSACFYDKLNFMCKIASIICIFAFKLFEQ